MRRLLQALIGIVFAVRDARRLGDAIFRLLGFVLLVMAALSLWVIDSWLLAGTAALFHTAMALVFRSPAFRRLPASMVFAVNVVVFLALPILYIGYLGPSYDFVVRFGASGTNQEYFEALPWAIRSLLICLLVLIAGCLAGNAATAAFRRALPGGSYARRPMVLAALGLLVAIVTIIDNNSLFEAMAGELTRIPGLLPFLLLDHAYLMLFPFLLYGAAPSLQQLKRFGPQVAFGFVLLTFVAVFVSATSKGALLNVAWYFFVFPLAYFYRAGHRIYWPSRTVMVVAALAVMPLFVLAQSQRSANLYGEALDVGQALSSAFAGAGLAETATTIVDRLSSSFQNYVMIAARFGPEPDPAYAAEFFNYLTKSLVNLVWLGTPYPEAYAPSSRLLAAVLDKGTLVGYDMFGFMMRSNTQPYTAIGTGLILFGFWATTAVLFVAGFLFAVTYNLAPHFAIRACLLFVTNMFFQVYGAEPTVQLVLHLLLASTVMLLLSFRPQESSSRGRQAADAPALTAASARS